MAVTLTKPLLSAVAVSSNYFHSCLHFFTCFPCSRRLTMSALATDEDRGSRDSDSRRTRLPFKTIDSHLHVWAAPQEAADKYPYYPGSEPTLPGDVDFLLKCMNEAGVDGALIVQPINYKFDHSFVTSVIKKYPTKFVGCCLANPAEDGSGIKQLEDLVLKDGYAAVRFNPYLWPSGEKMTNGIGRSMFSRAGELGIPVGFMCMKVPILPRGMILSPKLAKMRRDGSLLHFLVDPYILASLGLDLHISEIEELCSQFPSTVVLLDHLAFCKPPINEGELRTFSRLLSLSRFPQVHIKFSALFRVSRISFPYLDLSDQLSQVILSFGAHRVMWGSDFPFVVPECGYKGAKEAVELVADQTQLSASDLQWIMGKTVMELFPGKWLP